jgi:hypothetical protein
MRYGYPSYPTKDQQRAVPLAAAAIQRSIERRISEQEVVEVLLSGDIIEEYPEDKYGPSCLILGKTKTGRPLHVQCSLPPTVWTITLYEPDSQEWIDLRTRKK